MSGLDGHGAMSADARPGSRCTAQDGLGNRCIKSSSHGRTGAGREAEHDASRADVIRRWLSVGLSPAG